MTAVDERRPYQPDGNLAHPGKKDHYYFDVLRPVTGKPAKTPANGWGFRCRDAVAVAAETTGEAGRH